MTEATPHATQLRVQSDWRYEVVGARQHYVIEGWLGDALAGRAYGWFEPGSRFMLEKIEIDDRYRSMGYGSLLMEALRTHARESGCVAFDIGGVRAANTRAISWYESMGALPTESSGALRSFVIAPP